MEPLHCYSLPEKRLYSREQRVTSVCVQHGTMLPRSCQVLPVNNQPIVQPHNSSLY